MQLTYQSNDFRVHDTAQVEAFHSQLRCRLLIACAGREMSLSQLGAELAEPLPKLHYHVGRLLEAGLLTLSRSEPRAGRAIRHYRAVAERFWVPQAFLPELPGDAWAVQLRQALRDEHSRAGDLSLVYFPDALGKMMVRLIRDEGLPPPRSLELWRRMRLDAQQRTALGRELAELMERYANAKPGLGAESYLVHVAFAPRG